MCSCVYVCGSERQIKGTIDSCDGGTWSSEFCRGRKRPGETGLAVLSLKASVGLSPSS